MSTTETMTYNINVHYDDDGMLWADVQELPGCFASGGSLDELREALEEAISLYLTNEPDRGTIHKMVKKQETRRMQVDEMRVQVPA